jgi:6-phosphogluconate dehydrogenase
MRKEILIIGLGRMGSALGASLVEEGYTVHGYDNNLELYQELKTTGIFTHETLANAVATLERSTKTIWLMLPATYVDDILIELTPLLSPGDTVIDGGNSFFKKSIERHDTLEALGIGFIDCGTSGGVFGARHGASLMVGGDAEIVEKHFDLFTALAVTDGYAHVGSTGSGHFVKMVHNAIEYGMIGAIAEGVNILEEHKDALGIDVKNALKPYQHGSIIESSLMTWLASAYSADGLLEHIAGTVPKGETEMEMEYLVSHEQTPVLKSALKQRTSSRIEPTFTGALIAAMRNQFGGHAILRKNKK